MWNWTSQLRRDVNKLRNFKLVCKFVLGRYVDAGYLGKKLSQPSTTISNKQLVFMVWSYLQKLQQNVSMKSTRFLIREDCKYRINQSYPEV